MRITRVDIQGFKSFPDRLSLHVGSGISCVVGPNGCGKSNIVDALRWCIGEQSARSLRGSEMSDVIFAGSAQRKPVGFAEVRITFETEKSRPFPGRYAAMREVQIGRRLYRTGQSEYQVNQVKTRRKDVVELLMDSGFGNNLYAFIEQGRVGQIISATSAERRAVIDEAAGITGYRKKRTEAHKHLEATASQLDRAADVADEMRRRLASVERQVAKAAEARRLRSQIRQIEVFLALAKVQALDADRKALQARVADVGRDKVAAEHALRRVEGEVEDSRGRLAELDAKRIASRDALAELDAGLREAQTSVALEARRLEDREAERARLSADVERTDAEVDTARRETERARTELARLAEALQEGAPLVEDASVEEREAHDAGRELRAATAEATTADGSWSNARTAHRSADQNIRDAENACRVALAEALRERDTAAQNELQAAEAAESESLRDLQQTAAEADRSWSDARAAAGQCERNVADAQTGLNRIEARLSATQERLRAATGEASRWITAATSHQAALLDAVPESRRKDTVEALGDDAALPVMRELTTAIDVADRRPDKGAAHFWLWPDNVSDPPHADVRRYDDATAMLRAWWAEPGVCVCPQGWVSSHGRVVLGDKGAVTGLLDRIEQLQKDQRDAASVVDDATTRLDGAQKLLRQERQARDQAIDAVALAQREGTKRIVELRRSLSSKRDAKVSTPRTDTLEAELARARAEREQVLARMEAAVERRNAAHARRVAAEAVVRERTEAARRRVLACESRLRGAEATMARLSSQADAAQQAIKAIDASRGASEARLRELTEARIPAAAEHDAAREQSDAIKTVVRQTEQGLAGAHESLRKASSEWESLSARLSNTQQNLKTTSDRLEDQHGLSAAALLDHLAVRGMLRLDAERAARDSITVGERVFEGVPDLEVVAEQLANESLVVDRVRELDRLRSRRQTLGDVNFAAAEEYEDVRERHRALQAEREDLEASIHTIRASIAKMNRLCRERFRHAFDQVNDNFQETYPRLVGGGSARLSLTDEEDILECGVDIFVRPPGKRLQHLQLLSGGEKAMSAIALMISLFRVKPSPFCVLDEVDAPLDEANGQRFNDLLREMSDHSQFLVITHNRKTMECADTLYGVTMAQPGVSGLVSVRL